MHRFHPFDVTYSEARGEFIPGLIQAKLKVIDSNVPWAQEILENEGDLWLQYDMKKGSVVRQGTDLDTLYGKDGSIEQYMQKNDVLVATHVRKIKL